MSERDQTEVLDFLREQFARLNARMDNSDRWQIDASKRLAPTIIEGVRSPQEIKREKRRKRLMGEGA